MNTSPAPTLLVSLLTLMFATACDQAEDPTTWTPPLAERSGSAPLAPGVVVPAGFEAVEILVGGPLHNISGMALHPDGRIFVSDVGAVQVDGDETILAIDPLTGLTETIVSGLPLGAPGRMVFSDGRAPAGDRLLVADWNTELNTPCCGGRVLAVDVTSHGVSPISSGLPSLTVGDPYGIALGQSGFGGAAYVMDFQGASAQEPVLYQLDGSGTATHFASDASQWTTDRSPRHIVFGPDADHHGIFVVDSLPANPTIWHVDDTGTISPFFQGSPLLSPVSARFGRGDAFGTGMFVLDASSKEITVIDDAGGTSTFATGLDQATSFSDMVFAPGCGTLYVGIGDRVLAIRPQTELDPEPQCK